MNLKRSIVLLLVLLSAPLALAQPLNYAQASVQVKAGVLVLPGMTQNNVAANTAPHVWGNLDQDATVKPAKWTFSNPVGPTVLTSGVQARWTVLDAATPAVGTRLTKNTAPYWEVPLDTVDDKTLASYDVLSLSISRPLLVNPAERDKLRRYVDQGGVLWVDLINDSTANITLDNVNPLPFPFAWNVNSGAVDANLFHPLLQFPNPLTLNELAMTDFPVPAGQQIVTAALANGAMGSIETVNKWIVIDSNSMQAVAGTGNNQNTVSVGRIGQGYMVVTSRGITGNLNRGYDPTNPNGYLINRGFRGYNVPNDASFVAAAKFALNVVSLGGLAVSKDNGPRHLSSGSVDLTAPLLRRFQDRPGGTFNVGQQPALYKGRVIVTMGNQVVCYDARPDRDLDGDGNADDGLTNLIGSLADVVWVSPPLGARLSAPTVVESPNTQLTDPNRPGFTPTDQVWVTDENSNVYVFDLDADGVTNQAVLGNWPPMRTISPPSGTAANNAGPFAPTVQESLVFITDSANSVVGTTGRVWLIDLQYAVVVNNGTNDWAMYSSSRFAEPSASSTVGYIPIQDGSGGLDRVVYAATQSSTGITPRPAGLTSIWLGARAESPIRKEYDTVGGVLTLTTRASYNALPIMLNHPGGPTYASLGLKISLMYPNGDPVPANIVQNIFGSASAPSEPSRGVLMFTNVQTGGLDLDGRLTPNNPNDDVAFRVDYTVDWGQAGTGPFAPSFENYIRGNLELPDDNSDSRVIVGSPALAASGMVYLVSSYASGNVPGGTVYSFKENRGPGNFTMQSRFEVYDQLTMQLNNSTGAADQVVMPPVLTDEDNLTTMIPFLAGSISTWQFTSGPVIRGDNLFVMARGMKNGFIPVGVLLSFKADIGQPSFEVASTDNNFTLVQCDPALSSNKAVPEQYSVLQPGQFTVEAIPGTTRSRVILNSLMNVTRGRIRDSINTSLPLILRRGGQTDTLVEPEALSDNGRLIAGRSSGRWNPLNWYVVFDGYSPGAGPVVAGQTLYQGGASVLPGLISGQPGFQPRGLMFALDANISPNNEFLRANSVRPWTTQLNVIEDTVGNGNWSDIRGADSIKWPQFKGLSDVDDLRIRILQAAIEDDGVANLAAGDDSLAVTSTQSVYAFSRADFYVVDSGRIGRFDPAGNPIWATDQTLIGGRTSPTTVSTNVRQLSEPNRMYAAGGNGYWIVDTGNDRVVRLDGAGRELRSVESFKVDPRFAPDQVNNQGAAAGMAATESLKLKRPKDVLSWETLVQQANNPYSNPRPLERWVHMLIADSGNNRVIEVVDRYEVNPTTLRNIGIVQYEDPPASGQFKQAFGVLSWHTPEELSGKDYSYNSIARTVQDVNGTRHDVVAFGFGNVEPGPVSLGLDGSGQNSDRNSGYGGVVLYDGKDSTVIREFIRPPILQNTFIGEFPVGSGNYGYFLPTADQPSRTQKLVGLNSISLRYVDYQGNRVLSVMVTDATGVYELVQDTTQQSKPWVVRWMLPIEAYVGMRHPRGTGPWTLGQLGLNPQSFRPMYAQRLDSGEVLVVNGFVGKKLSGATFDGEVILVDGSFADANTLPEDPAYALNRANLGFNRLSTKFELPPVQGIRGIIAPVFAQRQ
ncbi:MAG: hypothetical protein JSS66_11290 [Armatimonadetes bacterium]|nr:hypothetical protein [Armatimonadota bacterium]